MKRIQNTRYCLIAVCLYASAASAQTGLISNVGTTANNMDAITFNSSGTLYGATSGAGSLYTINPATGAATMVHALVGASNASLTYGISGLAFQPGTGTLYGSTSPDSPNSGNSLVTINPANGQVTVIGATGTGRAYTDISFAPNGTLYGWLIGSGASTISAATINLTTGAGTSLGSPQTPSGLPDGGGLAVNASGVIYVAANGHAGAPCSPSTSCSGALWTINPANGATTTVATLTGGPGSAPTITALAFSPSGVLYGIEGGDGGATWNLITISVPAAAGGSGNTIVVPNGSATVAGNDDSGLPANTFLSIEAQTVIDPDQFPAGPILITGFAFRAAPGLGPLNLTFSGSIYLSTSPNYANPTGHPGVSTTFANNVGPDKTLVFSGNITISGPACAAPGPCPFANAFAFTTPFPYNPANGPLLTDLQVTSFGVTSGQLDVQDCNPASCSVAGINTVPLGSPTATKVNANGTVAQITYVPASSAGTTTNVNLNLTINSRGSTASHLMVTSATGTLSPLGNASFSLQGAAPISNNALAAPVQLTGGFYFNQTDSIAISFTENDLNYANTSPYTLSGVAITGGTGAYAGATGSLNLTFTQKGFLAITGSGSVSVGGQTTQVSLSNFLGISGCGACEVDYSTGTLTGTASPLGNVTATYRIDNTNTPPEPSAGAFAVSLNGTDGFNLFFSVIGLGQTVTTFPATASGGTGAYAGATGSFTLTLGQDSAGNLTIQGSGTITTAQAGVPIVTSVKTAFGQPVVAYNTWIQINGTNLAPSNTPSTGVDWSNAPDFASGKMPTKLGPISVTINGNPAYIYFYCSAATDTSCASDQINALVPLDTTLEPYYPVEVVVTNNGVSSTPFTVEKSTLSPTFPLFDVQGHIVARHLDFSLMGPTSLFPGALTPAKAGETIIMVLYGLGPPNGAVTEGSATQSGSMPGAPECWVSGIPVPASSEALALISPGLYQFNAAVPAGTPSGDNPIVCTYMGYATAPGALIAVQ